MAAAPVRSPRLRAVFRALTDSRPSNFRGILYMLAATLLFTVMGICARAASERIHPFEVVFFRLSVGLLLVAPLVVSHGFRHFRTRRLGLHVGRAFLHVAEMMVYFTGLVMIQYAQVQALTFTTPLFAALLAVIVLRERIHPRNVVALVVGFAGAMIVIRPGIVPVETGSLLILLAAVGWAGVILMVKRLTLTDSSLTITAWMVVLMSPMALVPALFVWVWPTWQEWILLIVAGLTGTLGQLAVTQAFRVADVTAVLPFDFSKLIWAALFGYLVFGEVPAVWTWIGGTAIFVCGFYIALRERRTRSEARQTRS